MWDGLYRGEFQMNLSFYTATVGAQQQQLRLDVHGNNIANVNNYGFKAKIPSFSQLMTGPVQGVTEVLARGVGSRLESAATDQRQSGFADTGRAFDYAIEGDGFFALLDPATGDITYTRDGSFTLSDFQDQTEDGGTETRWYLCDGSGRFVLGMNGQRIEATNDIDPLPVGVFDFINYDGMESVGENMFRPVDKNGGVRYGTGEAVQGVLETSNVDLAYELSKVIESQRSFSFMLRMVTASDEIETTVNNLR